MNVYDYRTIPPEESAYHARNSHGSEYSDDDIPDEDLAGTTDASDPKSSDFGSEPSVKDIIPDEVPRRDGPGGN